MKENSPRVKNWNREINRLRGISVLIILGYHLFNMIGSPVPEFFKNGQIGVDLFFVVSGYLIGDQLFDQIQDLPAPISFANRWSTLKKIFQRFYIRRCARILPLVLIWTPIYQLAGFSKSYDSILALTFSMNFGLLTGHGSGISFFWTLSIEEQFYVCLPLLFMFSHSLHSRMKVLQVIFLGFMMCKILVLMSYFSMQNLVPFQAYYHLRYDGIFCGLLLALATRRWKELINISIPSWLGQILALSLIISCFVILPGDSPLYARNALRLLLAPMAWTICVGLAVQQKNYILNIPGIRRFLEYCGSRSYGIYMAHTASILWVKKAGVNHTPGSQVVLSLTLTFLVTELVYRVFENPIHQWGYRQAERV